jgi:hypothetical protein
MPKRNLKDFFKNVDDSKFIEGIYNYCDTWCERCAFTNRCMNFAMSSEKDTTRNDTDFWEDMKDIFEQTAELLKEAAEERGIDWNEIEQVVENDRKDAEEERRRVKEHAIVKEAWKYMKMRDAFFENEEEYMKAKAVDFQSEVERGIVDIEEAERTVLNLEDAFEVINWYHTIIYVKISNACSMLFEEDVDDFMEDYYNGKAKLVLVSIDRSIAAWFSLQIYFPEKVNKVTDILLHLEKLRRKIETDFPKARRFKRVGLDDNEAEAS